MKRNLPCLALALFAALTALPAHAQTYDVTNITLPGATQWDIVGINAAGQVAGTTVINGKFRGFFVTQSDGTVDIGTLGGTSANIYAYSNAGHVVGKSEIAGGTLESHAFVWTKDGGMVDLGTLGRGWSDAFGVNDAGTVVGHSLVPGDGFWHAFSWTKAGGMVDLGSLGGDSHAYAINASGQVFGTSEDANGATHAVLWTPGSPIRDLGVAPSAFYLKYLMIDDAGEVAGLSLIPDGTANPPEHAFFYSSATGYVDLGTLGGVYSWPVALNSPGRVAGASLTPTNTYADQQAFTWTASEGVTQLTLGGGSSDVFDASSTGQIVGWSGTASGARQHAYSWTKSGGIVDLGTFGGSYSLAYGVNKFGQVVGISTLPGDSRSHGFLYDGVSVKDLNDLVPNKPVGMEIFSASRVSDSKAMIAVANTGFILLSPPSVSTAPPVIGQLTANDPVAVGATLSASATFSDAAGDTHTATFTFGDGTPAQAGSVTEANGAGTAQASHTYSATGVYQVVVTVVDNSGLRSQLASNVVVYDPSAGFVTGSGSIQSPAGAYRPDPLAMGPASFSFVSKYQKGANVPTGTTAFHFQSVNLDFASDSYDWLVIGGARAQFKGTGSLNGIGGYKFMLTGVDGDLLGGGARDRFRIKISFYDANLKQDVLVYDNQLDPSSEGTTTEGTAISAGNIVIHTAKK